MRSLAREVRTVTIHNVTTTRNNMGDGTTAETTRRIPGCLFEPAQPVERTDAHSPGVTTVAKFYLPVALTLDADDELNDGATVWQVVGGSSVWGEQTEVPVRKTGTV